MMLRAIETEPQSFGWLIGSPVYQNRVGASTVPVNSPCGEQSCRLRNANVPTITNVDLNPDKRPLPVVRWHQLLIGLLVSLILHCAVFAWILPNGFSPMIAGSGSAATLSSGVTTFEVLESGETVIEEMVVEYIEDTQPTDVPDTVPDDTEPKPAKAFTEPIVKTGSKVRDQTSAETPVESGAIVDPDIAEEPLETPIVEAITIAKPTKANRQRLARKTGAQKATQQKRDAKPATELSKSKTPQTKTKKTVAKATDARKKKTKSGDSGKSNASATKAGGRPGVKTNRAGGSAAVSNYPGKVYAKIARTRRVHTGSKGSAHVRFKIATNGRISAASVSRSSGNSKIDQAALAHIKRAAPFPKPPKGAKRTFVIPIEYRR